MKQFFTAIYEIIESIGRIKAAAHLASRGLHKEAQALMLAD